MRWRRQAGGAAAVLVGLPTLASAQQAVAGGCFDGTVGTDARTRRAIVEVTDARRGTLHVYTRPVRRLALHAELESGVAIAARTFRSNGDSASAVIAADASVADLTIRGARESMRARLGRVRPHVAPEGITADAAGEWVATMGPGGVIRLVARLGAGPCGIPVGWFDSPDQGQHDLPMTSVRVAGDSLEMRADYLDLRIALPLRGGDERLARMRQHGVETDVRFRRGASAVLHRPQEPRRPFPYDERDARFASRAAGITLAGTLTLPRAAGPHPAVVLISGSGAQDRDETVAGHRPFLVLADHLTRLGYAVLRFDDRWAGATAGAPLQTTLHDIAQDVHGAVDYLRTLADIDPRRVGLLGHSEGGYVAPIVAATDRDIAFLVLLGAPAVTGRDVLLSQSSSLLRASGEPEVTVRVDSLIRATVFSALAVRPADSLLERAVDSAVARLVRGLPDADRALAARWLSARTAAQDSAALALWRSRWFTSLFHHDPARYLASFHAPILALYGALDLQVPPDPSVAALEALYRTGRRHLLAARVLPGVNHMMQPAATGRMDEYIQVEQTIADDVLRVLADWIARTVPTGSAER